MKVDSVTDMKVGKDQPGYLVSFSYDFGTQASIHVKGLGVVSNKASYQYISTDPYLEFRDAQSDTLLERVPLKATVVVAAQAPLNEIPNEDQFSPAYRSYTWDVPLPLQEQINSVFAKYFMYFPHEHNNVTYLATTYTPLPLAKKISDQGISAQLALLLSFPYDPATGKYSFHIQSLVKEGRTLSSGDLRPTNNSDILQTAGAFVDRIINELKTGKQGQP